MMSAWAQGGGEDPFLIEVAIDENGGWVVDFADQGIDLSSQGIGALSDELGLGMAVPGVPPNIMAILDAADAGQLALFKEGLAIPVWIDGQPLILLTLEDPVVQGAIAAFIPELEEYRSVLSDLQLAIIVDLPGSPDGFEFDTSNRLDPAEVAAENVLDVGVTMSPSGDLLSIGGLATDALGLGPINVDLSIAQRLGVKEQVDLDLSVAGLLVDADGARWATLNWDLPLVLQKVPPILTALNVQLPGEMMDLVGTLLDGTDIKAKIYISDTPQDAPLVFDLGRPLVVEVSPEGAVKFEGVSPGVELGPQLGSVVNSVGSLGINWDGASRQLRLAAGGKPLPYLEIGEGFIPAAGAIAGPALPLDALAPILNQANLEVNVVAEGGTAVAVPTDYVVSPTKPFMDIIIPIKVGPNGVTFWGEPLPLGMLSAMMGTDLKGTVGTTYGQYKDQVQSASLRFGPGGLDLGLNGTNMALKWDKELRDNLLDLVLEQGPAMGISLPSNIGGISLKTLVGMINNEEFGFDLEMTDQEIPRGFLETILGWFLPG
jgi:hypothetical protein